MSVAGILEQIKRHPDIGGAGMILIHNGIVRSTARDGRQVSAVEVRVDKEKLNAAVDLIKNRPGIIEFLAAVEEGKRSVGEDLMVLAIAGDYRENVIPAMSEAIDMIKKSVVTKKEIFAD